MTLWQKLIISAGVALSISLISWGIHHFVQKRASPTWSHIFGPSLRRALVCLSFLLVASITLLIWDPSKIQRAFAINLLVSLIIISVTFIVASVTSGIIKLYKKTHDHGIAAATLTRKIAKAVIGALGLLVLLNYFNISIVPMLTAMGIGGVAIALGLQDTLTNVFAGIHILWDDKIRIGNYIKLKSGEEGYIHDIGWRETRMLNSNNLLTIPNSIITKDSLINYSQPSANVSMTSYVIVDLSNDLNKVENIARDVAHEVIKSVPGSVKDSEPSIRFKRVFDSGIELGITLISIDHPSQFLVNHELLKKLYTRFQKEGVAIPSWTKASAQTSNEYSLPSHVLENTKRHSLDVLEA